MVVSYISTRYGTNCLGCMCDMVDEHFFVICNDNERNYLLCALFARWYVKFDYGHILELVKDIGEYDMETGLWLTSDGLCTLRDIVNDYTPKSTSQVEVQNTLNERISNLLSGYYY